MKVSVRVRERKKNRGGVQSSVGAWNHVCNVSRNEVTKPANKVAALDNAVLGPDGGVSSAGVDDNMRRRNCHRRQRKGRVVFGDRKRGKCYAGRGFVGRGNWCILAGFHCVSGAHNEVSLLK